MTEKGPKLGRTVDRQAQVIMPEEVALWIKQALAHTTVEQLAQKAGVSRQHLYAILRGERGVNSEVAEAVGLEPAFIVKPVRKKKGE